jgi:hypothetical protein
MTKLIRELPLLVSSFKLLEGRILWRLLGLRFFGRDPWLLVLLGSLALSAFALIDAFLPKFRR